MRKSIITLLLIFFVSPHLGWGQRIDRDELNLEWASQLISIGKYDEAIKILENMKDSTPHPGKVNFLLKKAYLESKQYNEALNLISKELERFPKDFGLWCDLADVQFRIGQEEQANLSLNKALTLSPDDPNTYKLAASVYLRNNMIEEAAEVYELGRKNLEASFEFSQELANLYEISRDYRRAVHEYFNLMKGDSLEFDLVENRVLTLIETGEALEGVETALDEIMKNQPKNGFVYKLYGDVYFKRENPDAALESYKTFDLLSGGEGRYILFFAKQCLKKGYYDTAIRACLYVLSKSTDLAYRAHAQLTLASSQKGLGKYEDAIFTYEEVMANFRLTQYITESFFQIAEINFLNLKKIQEAISLYRKLINNYPSSERTGEALVRVGDCYLTMGDLDSAQLQYTFCLTSPVTKNKKEELIFKLAEIDFFQGELEKASDKYNNLVVEFPKGLYVNNCIERLYLLAENKGLSRPILLKFAKALFDNVKGKDDQAISELKKIAKAQNLPLSDDALYEIAKIYRQRGEFSQSLATLGELIQKHPKSLYCPKAQKLIGDVYNYDLDDKIKAKEAYLLVLKNYGDSMVVDEVREKIREIEKELKG